MSSSDLIPDELPASAAPAWRSYRAMLESKEAHYGFLEMLEVKYREGGRPSLAENARLATLLQTHDACVSDFAEAIKQLSASDSAARDTFLRLVSETGAGSTKH